MIEAVLGHQLATRERTLVSRQQIMDVHRSGIDILQIRSFQRKDTCVWTIELSMLPHKAGCVIGGIKVFAVACANVHLVVTGGSIKQPFAVDLAIEISERSGAGLFDGKNVA